MPITASGPEPGDDIAGRYEEDLARARLHPSRIWRAMAANVDAIRSWADGDLEAMRRHALVGAEEGVVSSPLWFAALQLRAWAAYEMGDFAEAVRVADDDIDHAHRYGDRSAMVIPSTLYALVLRAIDDVEGAATVCGALPRRLTVFLVPHLAELDRRLAEDLEPERRSELAAIGRSMDPRAIQAFTHERLAAGGQLPVSAESTSRSLS